MGLRTKKKEKDGLQTNTTYLRLKVKRKGGRETFLNQPNHIGRA